MNESAATGRARERATRSHESRPRGRPSRGAEVSALHGSGQGFQDPLAAPLRVHTNLACLEPLHGQSILEVLRTRPLTAPAPGSDRRLSGEGHQVGSPRRRSGHEQQRQVRDVRRRRLGPRPGMHVPWERAHLPAHDLHRVQRQRRARCVPDRKVISGESRPPPDARCCPAPAAGQVRTLRTRSPKQ